MGPHPSKCVRGENKCTAVGSRNPVTQNATPTGDMIALYGSVLKAVARAAEMVNQMKEPRL